MQHDLSREQARRWISREMSRLGAYDEIVERLETEKRIMAGSDGKRQKFPVSAMAREELIGLLKDKLDDLRTRLH